LKQKIKVAFASGTDDLNARLIARMRQVFPELPLYVVSDFEPEEKDVQWVRYQGGALENWARCRHAFRGKSIRLAGVLLVPNTPFRRMRLLALILAPLYFLAVNENLNEFMLRPRSLPLMARHFAWRARNFLRWHFGGSGTPARRGWDDLRYAAARIAGLLRLKRRRVKPLPEGEPAPPRSSVWPPGCDLDAPSLAALGRAFEQIPDLFCATLSAAPAGGLRYALPDGAGGALYDAARFRALGGFDPAYETAEARFLDLCYRAWQRGWPTVAAGASPAPDGGRPSVPSAAEEIDRLRFLARAVSSRRVFRREWKRAVGRLHAGARTQPAMRQALRRAPAIAFGGGPSDACRIPDDLILALTGGAVTVFPGKAQTAKPRVLVASAYLPFPLSHGGAVRIHNLTARAAADWDQVLVAFTETDAPPAAELLERFVEVVVVRREGSHAVPSRGRPEVVEQFASAAFRAALRETVRKWQPAIAQLEFTQMAQYAADCAPARTILVEHDITFDLYQQVAADSDDWDLRRQLKLWRRFETAAWRKVSCVAAMSEKDRAMVRGARAAVLPNGVDLDRFRFSPCDPEPGRLLFVGSFCHVPNLIAIGWFLDDVWPRLRDARLHIIAGERHEYFLDYHRCREKLRLRQPGVEVEGFVSDVRGAYGRAAIVVAPLVVSAGTNLKILEAMACGRPVVSTPAGVNGLDLAPGEEFVLARNDPEMADAIGRLLGSPGECRRLAEAGRRRVEESYGWDGIARRQTELYRGLMDGSRPTPGHSAKLPRACGVENDVEHE
jgi:glycosyltransferase involved in cell wall biosynthesis